MNEKNDGSGQTARVHPDDNPLRRGTKAIKGRLKRSKPHYAARTAKEILITKHNQQDASWERTRPIQAPTIPVSAPHGPGPRILNPTLPPRPRQCLGLAALMDLLQPPAPPAALPQLDRGNQEETRPSKEEEKVPGREPATGAGR